ncbi:hypothetical protein Tco_0918732 [Tanacetum coccineum]
MPRILIPLRPILGVLQIGIKSQGSTISGLRACWTLGARPGHILPIYVPFVPEPVYPEFLPVDDEVFPAEEQPMPAADSPTHQSPGYIPESDPEEDPEEDDEEDPEEDPADYPADRGDDRDDEEPSDDDDDDDDDAEEEEHLAPADPAVVAYSADQDPYLAYRVTARMPSDHICAGTVPLEEVAVRLQRDALPSPVHETEMLEICLPLRKRPCRTTPGPGYEVGESSDSLVLLRQEEGGQIISVRWARSMDTCVLTRSGGALSLRTTVMCSAVEITELQAAAVGADSVLDLAESRTIGEEDRARVPEEASSVLAAGYDCS